MSEPLVLYEARPPAVVVTLNRPDKRNALSRGLIAALTETFLRAAGDAAARCVILTGAGPVFCAGMDLAELQESLSLREAFPEQVSAAVLANRLVARNDARNYIVLGDPAVRLRTEVMSE